KELMSKYWSWKNDCNGIYSCCRLCSDRNRLSRHIDSSVFANKEKEPDQIYLDWTIYWDSHYYTRESSGVIGRCSSSSPTMDNRTAWTAAALPGYKNMDSR